MRDFRSTKPCGTTLKMGQGACLMTDRLGITGIVRKIVSRIVISTLISTIISTVLLNWPASAETSLPRLRRSTSPPSNSSSHPNASPPIRPKTQCPIRLESLIPLLLRDLPSYANRVEQQTAKTSELPQGPTYLLIAGRPEYEPLSLETESYVSEADRDIPQVFFTTLEHQYEADRMLRVQRYHWLFITPSETGWNFVLMRSMVDNNRPDQPPIPPQDSSQSVIAQAIRIWLRDCAAGSIAPSISP